MSRIKLLIGTFILIAALFTAGQITPVLAAPGLLDGTSTPTPAPSTTPVPSVIGTIQSIAVSTDSVTNVTTVKVTYTDKTTGATGTVTISLQAAIDLNLVTLDANGLPLVNQDMVGKEITIDSAQIIPEPVVTPVATNPVASAIASFFGLDYPTIAGYHDDGVGYGVIAQACWMSYELKQDASLCGAILEAKQTGDYSLITLPDGSTPTNWGQFKKAVSDQGGKHNLGSIVSGHALPIVTPGTTPELGTTPEPGTTPAPQSGLQGNTGNAGANLGNGNGNAGGNGNGNAGGNGNNGNHGNSGTGKSHGKH